MNSRSNIFSPLGVVSGGGVHGFRPPGGPGTHEVVKFMVKDPEPTRISPHLVQGKQPIVHVEDRVFESLGHEGSSELLKPHDDLNPPVLVFPAKGTSEIEGQKVLEEGELIGEGREMFHGPGHRLRDGSPVLFPPAHAVDIGAVDRKEGHHFRKGPSQAVEGDVASLPRAPRDGLDPMSQVVDIAGHVPGDEEPLFWATRSR